MDANIVGGAQQQSMTDGKEDDGHEQKILHSYLKSDFVKITQGLSRLQRLKTPFSRF